MGTTLIELIVALAVLGIVLGVSTAALTAVHRDTPAPALARMQRARARSLRLGVPVRLDVADSSAAGVPSSILLLPDGRVLGGGFDPLTGEAVLNASR